MHQFTISGSVFDIDARYRPIKPIGSGAYGLVIAAHDAEEGDKVAIKKVHRAFDDPVGAKRVLRELKLLMHFDHDNVISIQDILPPPLLAQAAEASAPPGGHELRRRSLADFVDVYIVTDLMETDLHRVIYSKQALYDEHVQYFLYQILCALKYIHSAGVMHRDLKPSNVLLNANCDLKICDFGLARGVLPSATDTAAAASAAIDNGDETLGGGAAAATPGCLSTARCERLGCGRARCCPSTSRRSARTKPALPSLPSGGAARPPLGRRPPLRSRPRAPTGPAARQRRLWRRCCVGRAVAAACVLQRRQDIGRGRVHEV